MVFSPQSNVPLNHDILGSYNGLDVLPIIYKLKQRKAYMDHA